MRALTIKTVLHGRKAVISTALAAAMLLFGCAMERTPGFGGPAPDCRISSVLYCDLAPHVESCQCVRRSHIRDMLRTPLRP